jgi:membrane fusion protein, multidrug efflux system
MPHDIPFQPKSFLVGLTVATIGLLVAGVGLAAATDPDSVQGAKDALVARASAQTYHDTLRAAGGNPAGVATGDSVRAVVRSFETAAISAELNARITYLPEREGDRFRKGDLLVEFDCRRIIAEHEAAVAAFEAQRANHVGLSELQRYQAAGTLAVDQARFEMQKAAADVRGLEVKRSTCQIYATFDGRVIEKAAHVHEIAQPNQPLIKIINERKLELVFMVPSSWLPIVAEGTRFSVRMDETGESLEARIVQSTGLIDPVSQSARLIAEIENPTASVLPGMSGTAAFTFQKASK